MLNIITNGYILPFITKPKLTSFPNLLRIQGSSKGSTSGLLYLVSSVKECYRKGGKCKISRVLQSPVCSPEASPKVEASDRPKRAEHLPISRKVQNGNTRVHQGLSDSRELVSSIGLSDAYLYIPIHPTLRRYLRYGFSMVLKCSSSPPSLLAKPRPRKSLQ